MSVFKRRGAAQRSAPPAEGVRTPSFKSPVPLLSSGIPALDDILLGGGISSGSVLTFVPCADTATASVAQLGATSVHDGVRDAADAFCLALVEPYTDLLLSYSAAQGIVSQHVSVVLGDAPDAFLEGLMGVAGEAEPKKEALVEETTEDVQRMKIAWRYDHKQRAESLTTPQAAPFSSVFDLSKRMAPTVLDQRRDKGMLYTFDPSLSNGDPFAGAWATIEKALTKCHDMASPVLRIHLRNFGSPSWHHGIASHLFRFLLQLRRLARTLALPDNGKLAVPCLVTVSLSAFTAQMPADGANVVNRLAHLSDACIGLSSFAASPGLRDVFPDFTGALRVFRTQAIGMLANPSLRASVLRGMGAGMAPSGVTAHGEGGAGGGENNLAFKVRRKRLVIETLHLDIEGGAREQRQKPKEDAQPRAAHRAPAATSATSALTSAPAPAVPTVPSASPALAPKMPAFSGLKSLRVRGLQSMQGEPRPEDYEF
ncbi:Elongator subunit elp4 [Malassezia vespertilionis]|uniref:Elongator complex protein 4 n=1 Tax=Malassezia vespertilionis TaxID=2020962 RepID=A0A2N1JG58_9BASI|nr:Elongator subunit elp4 [Malassezia vespertilionis]PKI85537.1 hypothetical protein MVES_000109 [Malassezia vespertilionis]WFD04786.1 Elongator subunit elp4 [Malassezia vespertilionis]